MAAGCRGHSGSGLQAGQRILAEAVVAEQAVRKGLRSLVEQWHQQGLRRARLNWLQEQLLLLRRGHRLLCLELGLLRHHQTEPAVLALHFQTGLMVRNWALLVQTTLQYWATMHSVTLQIVRHLTQDWQPQTRQSGQLGQARTSSTGV